MHPVLSRVLMRSLVSGPGGQCGTPATPRHGCIRKEGTSEVALEAVRRLEEVAKAVGGGYCRLQMPLSLAPAVRETVAGRRLGTVEGGGGGYLPPFQCIPTPRDMGVSEVHRRRRRVRGQALRGCADAIPADLLPPGPHRQHAVLLTPPPRPPCTDDDEGHRTPSPVGSTVPSRPVLGIPRSPNKKGPGSPQGGAVLEGGAGGGGLARGHGGAGEGERGVWDPK